MINLREVYIPRGKVRFDGNFIDRYPSLERIQCQSGTYEPSFWYGNLPLKGIEEKGNYPRTFIFSPYGCIEAHLIPATVESTSVPELVVSLKLNVATPSLYSSVAAL